MKSLNVIRDNSSQETTYHNTITGEELVAFLIDRKICSDVENAKKVGQKLQNLHALYPVYFGEDHYPEEQFAFEGGSKLYYVDNRYLVAYSFGSGLSVDGRNRRRPRRKCSRKTTAECCRSLAI